MPKLLQRLVIIFSILAVLAIAWYFISSNSKTVFGPFEKEPDVFVSGDSYMVIYEKDNQHFININGNTFGPYNDIDAISSSIFYQNYGFAYSSKSDEGNWYVNFNNVISGPYEEAKYISISSKGTSFAYKEGGQWYATIYGQTYGPYDSIKGLSSYDNNFIFSYEKDGKGYIFTNGEDGPTYDYIENVSANSSGVAYVYILSGEKFVNFNGKVFGPYSNSAPIFLFSNGFAFWYLDQQDLLVNLNDIVMGPYDSLNILKNSQSASFYYKRSSDNRFYISTNTRAFGPYNYTFVDGGVSQNKIGISYFNNGRWYVSILPAR